MWELIMGRDPEQIIKKGISGSTLKLIAIITMFIDHFAAIILNRVLAMRNAVDLSTYTTEQVEQFMEVSYRIYDVNIAMRCIGRAAFPIFCFLLVEGMGYTRNKMKYLGRLFVFALISEIPFNLGFLDSVWGSSFQNVFFTLLIGACAIALMEQVRELKHLNQIMKVLSMMAIVVLAMILAWFLQTDYGAYGVLTIAVMYFLRGNYTLQGIAGCSVLTVMDGMEAYAYPTTILFHFYNGKRGWSLKYFFYFFYPAHLLLLYGMWVIFW